MTRSLEPCPGAPFAMHHTSWCSTLMGATRDGCFLGKTNVCKPPHLCHLPKRRAHNWPAGPALQTACLWALPMVARGQLGWCPVAHLVSGAAICPGCAFAPVPAGSALLSHTCPRASMSDLLVSSTRPARPWLKHLVLPPAPPFHSAGIALGYVGDLGSAHKERVQSPCSLKVPSSSSRPVPRVPPPKIWSWEDHWQVLSWLQEAFPWPGASNRDILQRPL